MCSSRKYPYPPPTPDGGHFCFAAPTPLEFSFQEVLVIPPYPCNFHHSSTLIGYPLERIFPSKILVHYIIMQNAIVFAIK